jgi:phosphatidylserine/phosphatidylglycerophosphate/cardiolipin synthase-like enzyme
MELEFEAIWSDGQVSVSPAEAHRHYQAVVEAYRQDRAIAASQVGLTPGAGDPLRALAPGCDAPDDDPTRWTNARIAIAFSARSTAASRGPAGSAAANRQQRIALRTAGGRLRLAPLTITNLALDTLASAHPNETLQVAMYGLSPRVAEFGALLDAARRGVRLQVLLNRQSGLATTARLATLANAQRLPIEVRTAGRMMHQKYVVHHASGTVVTGTANMSTDASTRHWEHRIRIIGCAELAARYSADFQEIWTRLPPDESGGKRLAEEQR